MPIEEFMLLLLPLGTEKATLMSPASAASVSGWDLPDICAPTCAGRVDSAQSHPSFHGGGWGVKLRSHVCTDASKMAQDLNIPVCASGRLGSVQGRCPKSVPPPGKMTNATRTSLRIKITSNLKKLKIELPYDPEIPLLGI